MYIYSTIWHAYYSRWGFHHKSRCALDTEIVKKHSDLICTIILHFKQGIFFMFFKVKVISWECSDVADILEFVHFQGNLNHLSLYLGKDIFEWIFLLVSVIGKEITAVESEERLYFFVEHVVKIALKRIATLNSCWDVTKGDKDTIFPKKSFDFSEGVFNWEKV